MVLRGPDDEHAPARVAGTREPPASGPGGRISPVPAEFTRQLCGYRSAGGNPNTSDSNDGQSVRLGRRLFQVLGVPDEQVCVEPQGTALEDAVVARLRTVRPDLRIERSRAAREFAQYAHLAVYPRFHARRSKTAHEIAGLARLLDELPPGRTRTRLEEAIDRAATSARQDEEAIEALTLEMPQESFLKIDVSVGVPQPDGPDELAIAISGKWSLRTDRAQDCVSQGNKLVALRRGRMPHFAAITIEPRPAMLTKVADGSGSVDWVYHLDLPALTETIAEERSIQPNPATWSPGTTFDRLMWQRRVRDFDELVGQVEMLPRP